MEHLNKPGAMPQTAEKLSAWWISRTYSSLIDFVEALENEMFVLGAKWR
jgi:hypothetical protein